MMSTNRIRLPECTSSRCSVWARDRWTSTSPSGMRPVMMPCVALPMISPWRICRLRQPTATSWRSPFVLRKHRTARLLTELIGFHLRKVGQRCPASMSGRCRSVVPAFRAREGEGMAACREPRGDGPSGRGYRQPLADDCGGVRGLDRRWPADHAGHDVRSADCGVLQPHRQHLRAAVPDVGTGGAVPCRCRGAGTSQADLRRVRVVRRAAGWVASESGYRTTDVNGLWHACHHLQGRPLPHTAVGVQPDASSGDFGDPAHGSAVSGGRPERRREIVADPSTVQAG